MGTELTMEVTTEEKGKKRATPTEETFVGIIKVIGETFGFIECEEVKALYNKDVFVPAKALVGREVNDVVEFDLQVNDKGQPQASDVWLPGEESNKRQKVDKDNADEAIPDEA